MMSNLKEYIVTLKSKDDLDQFYQDMETEGGDIFIPNRVVDIVARRENSRNTHYSLSKEEAEQVKQDSRVLSVELTPEERGLVIRRSYTQTGEWDKSNIVDANYNNWGLLRCIEGQQRANWGNDGTQGQTATINMSSSGRNVDVVIIDGHIIPTHPEYAVNSDGTGGSRVVQYNWFQHRAEVDGLNNNGNYVYFPYTGTEAEEDNNHGAHVAGTACGNTQGWARSSTIYNISPYGTNLNGNLGLLVFDYVRAFHNSKSVNPATGRKNPTITNNSWGYSYYIDISSASEISYRGQTFTGPFDLNELASFGLFGQASFGGIYLSIPARVSAIEADIADAIDDGILVVGAAGNDSATLGAPNDIDWFNSISFPDGATYFTSDLGSPGGAVRPGTKWGDSDPTTICVGSIGISTSEVKSDFSNRGARIDIWAPGTAIQSSVNIGFITDNRSSGFTQDKFSGTSMASPQVCGLLACALEVYPTMTNVRAREYLNAYAKTQVGDPDNGISDVYSLLDSPNRYLAHKQERPLDGAVYPKRDYFIRPTSGQVYPRTRIKR